MACRRTPRIARGSQSHSALGVESAAGLSFDELVDTRILTPLGMTNSAYMLADLPVEPTTLYGPTILGSGWRPFVQYGFPAYPDGSRRW